MKKGLSVLLTIILAMTMIFTPSPVMATENGTASEEVLQNSQGMINDISAEGSDSTGDLISQAIMSKQTEQDQNNGCNIYAVEVEGKKASISFETIKDCTLLVAIYDEAGTRMLASGKKDVKKGDTETTVTVDTNNMPKYFYLRAYLIESKELQPLCTAYESPNYTQKMSQFFLKTTNDFASDQVVNFDNDKKNNFAVYDKDTKLIEQKDNQNIVKKADDKKKEYVFEKISKAISTLKKGDIFSYQYENGETLIVKVGSIKILGTTATITGTDTSLNEVFDYVKIDTTNTVDDAEIDASELQEGVSYNGITKGGRVQSPSDMKAKVIDFEGKGSGSMAFGFDKKIKGEDNRQIKISGQLSLQLESTFKLYSEKNYKYVELKFDSIIETSIGVSGKLKHDIELANVKFQPIPCVNISVKPKFVIEFSGKINFAGKIKSTYGGVYSSDGGYKSLNGEPKVESEVKVEGTVFIGLALKPAVNVIDDVLVSVNFEARGGVEISAADTPYTSNDSQKHDCSACLDGKINFKADLTYGVELLKILKYEAKFFECSFKITDFYYSLFHNEFGLGNCPHIQYKVAATVKDVNNKPVEGATIDGSKISDAKGMAVLWFGNGSHDISVAKKGYQDAKKTINVYDRPMNVDITLYEDPKLGHDVTISVVDENGDPIEGAMINGVPTDSKGIVVIVLSNGTQTITVKKDGYADVTQNVTVNDDTKNVVITMGREQESEIQENKKTRAYKVSLGADHSAVVMENGDLYTWGWNYYGALGNGTSVDSLIPIKIMEGITDISAGTWYSAAVKNDGSLYAWGRNSDGQLGIGQASNPCNVPVKVLDEVKKVETAVTHSAALLECGDLYCWGYDNLSGCLGVETDGESIYTPIKVLDNVKSFSIADRISAAVTKDGDLYTWGAYMGTKKDLENKSPTKVMEDVAGVAVGSWNRAAVKKNGNLYTWGGKNDKGQIGDGTTTEQPTPVKIMSNILKVSVGENHCAAITKDGDLYTWGDNSKGQLGTGTKKNQYKPVKIMANVAFVSLGDYSSAAITKDGSLYTWGDNSYGQLGDGTTTSRYKPTKITVLSSSNTKGASSTVVQTTLSSKSTKTPDVSTTALNRAVINATTTVQTKSYKKLRKNTLYNFYVMKDRDSEEPLASDNLLYIGQKTSDKNGGLLISYGARENYSGAEAFVVGASEYDLQYAKPTTSFKSYTYTGKIIKPAPRLVINGKTLKKNKDYTVAYSNNKQIGQASITLKGKGKYTGQRTIYFNIVPKKVTVSSAKSLAKKSLQIKWKKVSSVTGYQVQWSKSKKFTFSKSAKIVGVSKTTRKITKLSSKKKYYVRVRAYKTVQGKNYYGKWSVSKVIAVK
ncbi:fibronectin type III domain-containing protein [Emergencia sp.]|uniref:fibronectin type III domain-containing protein n=1 Tax=Emergencia sp. TaxID=1926557 RepID=UPI003AF01544